MNLELSDILELVNPPIVTEAPEYRLYYNSDGCVVSLSERDHPEGDYIVLDDPSIFFNTNTRLLRVIDSKLVTINAQPKSTTGLQRSNTGQRVVKGLAALALTDSEEYQDIEYYDRKTNN